MFKKEKATTINVNNLIMPKKSEIKSNNYNSFTVIKAITLLEKKGKISSFQATNLFYEVIYDLLLKKTEDKILSYLDNKVNSFINHSFGKYNG